MLPKLFGCFICLIGSWAITFGQSPATDPVTGLHENPSTVFALTDATLYVSPDKRLENATLIIRNGLVEAAGTNLQAPADAFVISLKGKTIYPGFIDLYAHYGTSQAKNSRPNGRPGQRRQQETPETSPTGHWNAKILPQNQAISHFKKDEKGLDRLRQSGFTAVVTHPSSGLMRGSAALVLLGDGPLGNWVLNPNQVQSLTFGERSRGDYPSSLMGMMALFRQTFMDANWYQNAWTNYRKNPKGQTQPETNDALAALARVMNGEQTVVFKAESEWDVLNAMQLAKEFNLKTWVVDDGASYRRKDAIRQSNARLILPLEFPEAPDVSHPDREKEISLREMRHWHQAPSNAAMLGQAGVNFSLSAHGMKNASAFLKNLRAAAKRGLTEKQVLSALTTTPAAWIGQANTMGTLEKGSLANFVITTGPLLNKDSEILETWVRGHRHRHKRLPSNDIRGNYVFQMSGEDTKHDLEISGKPNKLSGKVGEGETSIKLANFKQDGSQVFFTAPGKWIGAKGKVRASGFFRGKNLEGQIHYPNGKIKNFTAAYKGPAKKTEKKKGKKKKTKKANGLVLPAAYPDGAFGRQQAPEQPKTLLVRNATLWTSGPEGTLENADLLIKDGKVAAVGKNLKAGSKAVVIDATGKHVTPGLIDAHSHTAIRGGVNEGTHSITAEVRIADAIDPDDINIYRQLAGGLTMGNLLHGSANTIGGQNAVLKWRWGATAQEMLFDGAMPGIKFALGENVKQSNWGDDFTTRYPQTRMGVEQFFQNAFMAAKEYRKQWQAYENAANKAELVPPRKVLTHEALLEILDGKRQIHCHSYRQDEILALIRVAEAMGFKVDTFTHILEGYKVAEAMAKHGAMGSTFSDWWAYKMEVLDAIPYAGALMHENGVVVSFKSDSDELARRLNTEAAKAVKYGGVSPEDALRFVTLNAAKQLRIEDRVGSLEKGKDADFVIWSHSPLSSYTQCEQTWIDGRKYFDLEEDRTAQAEANRQRQLLVQKILNDDDGQGDGNKKARGRFMRPQHSHFHHPHTDHEEFDQ